MALAADCLDDPGSSIIMEKPRSNLGELVDKATGNVVASRIRWCSSFGCKLRGLMFRQTLEPEEGLLMVEPRASRTATSIHMMFMAFPIAVFWLDESFCVVDRALARPWRLAYAPAHPARYTVEAHPDVFERVHIGDCLEFRPAP
jgi:uncharacterized membrane protein (UPF0127 family)